MILFEMLFSHSPFYPPNKCTEQDIKFPDPNARGT